MKKQLEIWKSVMMLCNEYGKLLNSVIEFGRMTLSAHLKRSLINFYKLTNFWFFNLKGHKNSLPLKLLRLRR